MHLKGRVSEMGRGKILHLLEIASQWLKQLELNKAEARIGELHLHRPLGDMGPSVWAIFSCLLTLARTRITNGAAGAQGSPSILDVGISNSRLLA